MQSRHLGEIFQRPNQVQHCFFVSSEEFLQATNAENLGARGCLQQRYLILTFLPHTHILILSRRPQNLPRRPPQIFPFEKIQFNLHLEPSRLFHNLNATGSRWLLRAPRRKSKTAINHQPPALQPGSAFPQRRSLEPRSSTRKSSDGNSCPIQELQPRSLLCSVFLVLRLCW
jgi:hypothetical protein